jgi:hypothetical protein
LRKLNDDGTYTDLAFSRARKDCNMYRRKILHKSKMKTIAFNKMVEDLSLDVIYPIDKIILL